MLEELERAQGVQENNPSSSNDNGSNSATTTAEPKVPELESPKSTSINLPIIVKETVFLTGDSSQYLRISAEGVLQHSQWKDYNTDVIWTDVDYDVRTIENFERGVTLYIKNDNSLWGYGNGSNGMLGDGTGLDRDTPVKILDDVAFVVWYKPDVSWAGVIEGFYAVKTDKTVWQWGGGVLEPLLFTDDIVYIDKEYGRALTSSGSPYEFSLDGPPVAAPSGPDGHPLVDIEAYQYGSGWWVDKDSVLWDNQNHWGEIVVIALPLISLFLNLTSHKVASRI